MTPLCRACGADEVEVVYRQAAIPAHSSVLVETREEALAFPMGTMALAVCHRCGYLMNAEHDPALEETSNRYEESQAFSPLFTAFADGLAVDLVDRHGLRGGRVVEVGCGKAEFLATLCAVADAEGIGIDPTATPDRVAADLDPRITLLAEPIGVAHEGIISDAIVCRHTLEHIHDPRPFLAHLHAMAASGRDAVLVLEVPDTARILDEVAFWDVYYEHCAYFTAGSLAALVRRAGFEVTRLERVYGEQYLLLEARPGSTGGARPSPEVVVAEEEPAAIVASARRFATSVDAVSERWRSDLAARAEAGQRVAVWGGGSKGVAFISGLGLADEIAYVVDINPFKQGKFLGGSGHAVLGPADLPATPPDLVVAMNAIYRDEIAAELDRRGIAADVVSV